MMLIDTSGKGLKLCVDLQHSWIVSVSSKHWGDSGTDYICLCGIEMLYLKVDKI